MGLDRRSRGARFRRALATAAAVTATIAGSLVVGGAPASAAAAPDGLTQETAAASCWEVKQNDPTAPDGVYWLVTPRLVAPQQFYCDQTTGGGGWVLIGRGREGWKEGYNGVGTPEQVRDTPAGTAAFAPAQLSSKTIDGLLDGGRVDALQEGVRVRRALDTAGSAWQEVRFSFANRDRWVWTMGGGHVLTSFSFKNPGERSKTTGSGGTSAVFGVDTGTKRVRFEEGDLPYRFRNGWSFGAQVSGSEDPSSYLWAPAGTRGKARPFAQVFLQPKLMTRDLDYGTIGSQGAPAITQSAIPNSNAMTTTWGVAGLANGLSGEANTEVASFGEAGGNVFVGGNFATVQQSEAGAGQVAQPYLAAFALGTGAWVSSFRPVLNGQVKAIAGLPDGRVAIGGQFSTVNGVPQAAIAFLDPATGQLSGPQVVAEHRAAGAVPYVRDFDVQGDYLYVAGSFTHLRAASSTVSASAWDGGRIDLTTGRPDTAWNANLNGTSMSVDASAAGDRAYFAGYFTMQGAITTTSAAALQTTAGAAGVTPHWTPTFSRPMYDAAGNPTGWVYQNAVTETGGRLWLGGSQHSLFSYDRTDFRLISGNVTLKGGDFQTIAQNADSTLIAAGCHCGDWVYEDAYTNPETPTTASEIDDMSLIGVWDAVTGRHVYEFAPDLQAREGHGAWASFFDSTGVLWAGGDITRSVRAGGSRQWSGGFVRFAPRDSVAPAVPTGLTVTPAGGATTLTWNRISDSSSVTYEVLRGNRVIASTTAASYTAPASSEAATYYVRARDAAGNRSATTAGVAAAADAAAPAPAPAPVAPDEAVTPDAAVQPGQPSTDTFIANGATWSWRYSADPLPADWNTVEFDASAWHTGPAVLARGVAGAATDIDPDDLAVKPQSAHFRTAFTVDDLTGLHDGTVSVIADDGVAVYLNGVEIGRSNLPADATLRQTTFASSSVAPGKAAASRASFTVPVSLLRPGVNVMSAEVHENNPGSATMSFDLTYTAPRN